MEEPSRPHAAFEDRARAAFASLTRSMPATTAATTTTETMTAANVDQQQRIGPRSSSSPPPSSYEAAAAQQQPAAWSVSASAPVFASSRKNAADFSEDDEAEERVRVQSRGGGGGEHDEDEDLEEERDDPLGLSREACERGFLPSEAYCRQLDKEEEFDAIDAIADPGEAERRRRAGSSGGGGAEEERGAAGPSTAAAAATAAATTSALAAAVEASNATATKRVRFEGVSVPWVPPHRRPGWSGGIGAGAVIEE